MSPTEQQEIVQLVKNTLLCFTTDTTGMADYVFGFDAPTRTLLKIPKADLAGVSGGHYIHRQAVAASTWLVNHNLGYKPGGILILDSAGTQWFGTAIHTDNDNLILDFNGLSFGGKAYLS